MTLSSETDISRSQMDVLVPLDDHAKQAGGESSTSFCLFVHSRTARDCHGWKIYELACPRAQDECISSLVCRIQLYAGVIDTF